MKQRTGCADRVKHVKRQMALLEAKQQPRAVAKHEQRKQTGGGGGASKHKLAGDRLMKAGDYRGAADAYGRAKEQAALRAAAVSGKRAGGGGTGRAFSRVPIGGR
jgi:hypothetical protein